MSSMKKRFEVMPPPRTEDAAGFGSKVVPERVLMPGTDSKVPWVNLPQSVIHAVARRSPNPLLTKGELKRLRDAQKEYEEAEFYMTAHSVANARKAFLEQSTAVVRRIHVETCGAPDPSDFWSQDEMMQDFEAKRKTAKHQARAISFGVRDIADRVARRINTCAEVEAKSLEATEALIAEEFGVSFEPSPLLRMLRSLTVRTDFAVMSLTPPAQILRFAGLDLDTVLTAED